MMKHVLICLLCLSSTFSFAQDPPEVLTLAEYLGYVKTFHPVVKQARLIASEGEAKLMESRGAFDPKLEVDFSKKEFKGSSYYNQLNTAFKIPTWYGIELKAAYENNDGLYLSPEKTVPDDGLFGVGVSVSLMRDLLINKRMALLKQARLYVKQAKAEQQLQVNQILYEAALSYFKWLQSYNEKKVYEAFLENAQFRFDGIKKSYESGELPAIDTLEARITLNTRKLNLEKARITYVKSGLALSNFLWLNDNTPVELREQMIPDVEAGNTVDTVLNTSALDMEQLDLSVHPKLQALDYKLQGLNLERKLKMNALLPRIDLQYQFLSETPELASSFNTMNYKSGLQVNFPLFLRKERGALRLANLKMQNMEFDIAVNRVSLRNKIDALNQELASYVNQTKYTEVIVADYQTMLEAEERKFFLGESALFLVNTRESKLIDAKLKAIELETAFNNTKAALYNVLARPEPDMP
ncbi:TolC family protein [Gaetbulibacter aestuarii]|uniref:TolC family protein n=1 Tax=Gaetbulibacter aestuarii TaxID=1502358 RepID=A0ABW7MXC1_9FLAO